jgi:NodT family efflux transporter outer membrane factor (OMF) lipoprotein
MICSRRNLSLKEIRGMAGRIGTKSGQLLLLVITAGLLLLPIACSVGPDYVRPTTVVPPAFKEVGDWKVAEPSDHKMPEKWWETFNDPQLNTLEEQVNISNQNIAVAEAQYRQAQALVQAAQAAFFPTVTGGVSFTRSLRSGTITNNPVATGVPTSDFNLPVNFSWEADVWGRIRRSVEASRASAQASAADLQAARLSVQTALAQNYFQLRALDAQKKLLDATVAAYQKSLELTTNRYNGGVATKGDVLFAETQLKSTQAQAIDVGVQRAQLEHAIALLTGKPASLFSLPPLALNIDATPPDIPPGVPSELLERRPDIAGAERRMAAANAQIGVVKAAWFPRATLSAAGGYESGSTAQWLTWPSHFWSLGPALAETLFDGGLRSAQTAQARAAYDATVAFYRQTVLTGFQEVEDNLAALRILEQEAMTQQEALKAARQSLAFTMNQYKAGTINYLAVIVIQAAVLNSESTAVNIMARRMNAGVLLVKALGGGWNASAISSEDKPGGNND